MTTNVDVKTLTCLCPGKVWDRGIDRRLKIA